ncbi:MAG: quinone-dependent dihydroorotate dehydrogenase, partial [Polyangiaceae bacterium]|nr:quinone-dependent dihydroorotate dehydrogenase [Polyangiaceae bacterium]
MIYRWLLRPLFYRLPAETAHHLAMLALRLVSTVPGFASLLRFMLLPRRSSLEVSALGQRFPTPVGLAAGFDKDAVVYDALTGLGFGFVEVGTLTALAQPGNPRPRLFRLPRDRALVNRMGFNNRGSLEAASRLARPRASLVGVNIGKSKVVPEADAIGDYVESARRVARHSDYVAVNVSSPNTPGLRDLQAVDKLRPLLAAVRVALDEASTTRRIPLLVKIAPDLADADVDAVAEMALSLGLDGIIATNTTIARSGLTSAPEAIAAVGAGGLSGAPLFGRSLEVLRRLRARTGNRLVLVSVGGIETAEQAFERIRAGATLVQVYT